MAACVSDYNIYVKVDMVVCVRDFKIYVKVGYSSLY